MRRFTKVASLLAAISVLACGAAFAAPYVPGLPMNLFTDTDVILLSDDVVRGTSADRFVTPGSGDKSLLKFGVTISTDAIYVSNDKGIFANSTDLVSFDKIVVRTTKNVVPMEFSVSMDVSASMDNVAFGLARGAEYLPFASGLAVPGAPLARNCTIGCGEFFFRLDHDLLSKDAMPGVPRTMAGSIRWIPEAGTDREFYVQCCPSFNLAASGDEDLPAVYSTSRDFVVARLSETPFVRVRVADRDLLKSDTTSRDFRATYWKTNRFSTSSTRAVDVPEGKTFNMGVAYTASDDASVCESRNPVNAYLPYVSVTNLGTQSVWVLENFENDKVTYTGTTNATKRLVSNTSWLGQIWGGLCHYDDTMVSSDTVVDQYGGLVVNTNPNDRSSMYEFPCHLYPAFSNTWRGVGNMDFNYSAAKAQNSSIVTRVQGRLNTAWAGAQLGTSSLCPTCVESGLWIHWPSACAVENYEEAMKKASVNRLALSFATTDHMTLQSFNQTAATGEYSAMDAVLALKSANIVASPDVIAGTKANVAVAKLKWNLSAANLSDAGLLNLADGQWWRAELWNKLAIKINGIKLDPANVETVNALSDLTAEELSFLTIVDGPQRNLNATSTVDVSLYVFVVDSNESAVKYYRTAQGNRFVVVYDGNLDGKFSVRGAIVKGTDTPAPTVFGVNPTTLSLNLAVSADKTKALNAVNAPAGAEVVWEVISSDIVSLDTLSGLTVNATGLAVGTTKVTAMVSGDASKSADVTVTVVNEAPVDPGSSSSGCNVGFAPALLLLLAPLAFLKK